MSKIKVTHTNSIMLFVYMTYKVIRKILHEGKIKEKQFSFFLNWVLFFCCFCLEFNLFEFFDPGKLVNSILITIFQK